MLQFDLLCSGLLTGKINRDSQNAPEGSRLAWVGQDAKRANQACPSAAQFAQEPLWHLLDEMKEIGASTGWSSIAKHVVQYFFSVWLCIYTQLLPGLCTNAQLRLLCFCGKAPNPCCYSVLNLLIDVKIAGANDHTVKKLIWRGPEFEVVELSTKDILLRRGSRL